MKRKLLILSALLLAPGASLLANSVSASPNASSKFGFTLEGLYLQPGANNLDYAVYTEPLPAPTPNWDQESVKPGYSPVFDLGMQYLFPDQVDQITLDWLHLNTSNTASSSASGTASVTPPYYFGPLAQLTGSFASSNVKFTVDNVNLAFDHLIHLGHYIAIDPFAGLSTAFLKQQIRSTYLGSDNIYHDPYSITSDNTSKYTGVGPRLGVNASAILGHFGILAEMGAALFVGSMHSTTGFTSYGEGNSTPVSTSLANTSQTQVVPALDSKLGLTYTLSFHSGSRLSFQAGYLFATYLNGINQVVPTSLVPNAFSNGVVAVETSQNNQSDLDLNGPFLEMTWLF